MSVRILVGIVKRLAACVFVSVVVLFACRAAAKDSQPQWKILQVKDFTATPNVKFTPEALNAFNETLRERLQKSGIADQVLDGNSTTPRADAGEVVILEGQLTNYLATPIAWDQDGSLNVEVTLYRGSDRRLIATIPLFIKLQYRVGNGKALGKETGHSIADAFRKAATDVPPLNSLGASGSPAAGSTPAVVSRSQAAPAGAEVLNNNSVLEMTAAKLPEDVIIARIQTSSNSFDLSTPALAELSQKGVSAAVMKAMIVAPGSVQAPGQAQAPSQAGTRGGNPLQTVPSTWTDPSTGLMWTLKDYDDSVDWKVADGYCRNLGLGGFYDWRLPTIDELAGIFDTSQNVNKKHIKGGIHVEGTVWSSNKGHLLVQDFDFHSGKRDTMPPAYSLRVLCVRTAGK